MYKSDSLKQYLHVYCNYQQDNWSELLPLVEFAYNNAPSATTGVSPFFANKGYHPNITVHPQRNIASSRACDFAIDLNELQSTLKTKIRWCTTFPRSWFQSRWQSLCQSSVLPNHSAFKETLLWKYIGPYEIIAQPGTLSFTLRLPESMCSVHPVFHVSMFEPATSNTFSERIQLAPAPVIIDREPKYEISWIVDFKIDRRQIGRASCRERV